MQYFSHIKPDKKEILEEHLRQTAELASYYAASFGGEKIAEQIGLLHDIGKHTQKFQDVLQGKAHHIDHAAVGAEYYWNESGENDHTVDDMFIAQTVCNCINSHHSDLHGCLTDDIDGYMEYPDEYHQITDNHKEIALGSDEEKEEIEKYVARQHFLKEISESDHPDTGGMNSEAKMLYERMLFSCQVDADYSSTAAFYDSDDFRNYENSRKIDAAECLRRLDEYRSQKGFGHDTSGLNALRNEVYNACEIAGRDMDPGLYTLTAPTGTGKTHALIRFALEQTRRNDLERIFVVLPYLSIIEQNAHEYKEIFGEENCLENDSQSELSDDLRLLADRWDYPIIVTTSVNFFETLCGAKASKERKLHQLANSVIVFDESQTLPSELLDVTMNTLEALTEYFHSTVLLSTATQPDYHFRKSLEGLKYQEVIKDVPALYSRYDYTRKIEVTADVYHKQTYEELADHYDAKEQLFVFNTTGKALKMYDTLCERFGEDDCFLLSSSLCSEHKSDTIKEIERKIENNEACFVSATQCIEAGVDLDFPVGMRECAPFSSVVQTSGRINRNARGVGQMMMFVLDEDEKYGYPGTTYRNESYVTRNLAEKQGIDINDLKMISEYYKQIYSEDAEENRDKKEIREAVEESDTKKLSDNYRLIEDSNELNVIVPYNRERVLYEKIYRELEFKQFCISRSEIKECSSITVRLYGNRKIKEYLEKHCRQLYMNSTEKREADRVNWYIVEDVDVYEEKRGFIKEEKEGGFIF